MLKKLPKVKTKVLRVKYFSIKEPCAARSLANHLVRSPNDSIILTFADSGPLIGELLSKQFKSLTVCEPNPKLRQRFSSTVESLRICKNVHVHDDNLFHLAHMIYDDFAQKRCAEIVKEASGIKDARPLADINPCDRKVKVLVPLSQGKYETGFLKSLYNQVVFRLGLFANSWVHYYMLMSDRQHAYLMAQHCEKFYRSSSVLYNTIFDVKTLESYDLVKCFGINVNRIQNTVGHKKASYKQVHLVWLEPRLDMISNLDARALIVFRFLVTQMMTKKNGLVFAFLDRFFDNYRSDLCRLGITATTRCGELSREQYYDLFVYLRNRDDYKNSTFVHAAVRAEENLSSV